MIGRSMYMAKKIKKEGKIKNSKKELPVDFAAVKNEEQWEAKTLEVESETTLEQDSGTGEQITLRFFTFGANAEVFKRHKPTTQDLFNHHWRQIQVELWKDEWKPFEEVQPRFLWSTNGKDFEPYSPAGKQYTHYQIVIAATPARMGILNEKTHTLSELATHGNRS